MSRYSLLGLLCVYSNTVSLVCYIVKQSDWFAIQETGCFVCYTKRQSSCSIFSWRQFVWFAILGYSLLLSCNIRQSSWFATSDSLFSLQCHGTVSSCYLRRHSAWLARLGGGVPDLIDQDTVLMVRYTRRQSDTVS
jgi:hypothetical protein